MHQTPRSYWVEFQQASGLIQRLRHMASDAQPDNSGSEKFRAWSPNRKHLNHKLIVKQNTEPEKKRVENV